MIRLQALKKVSFISTSLPLGRMIGRLNWKVNGMRSPCCESWSPSPSPESLKQLKQLRGPRWWSDPLFCPFWASPTSQVATPPWANPWIFCSYMCWGLTKTTNKHGSHSRRSPHFSWGSWSKTLAGRRAHFMTANWNRSVFHHSSLTAVDSSREQSFHWKWTCRAHQPKPAVSRWFMTHFWTLPPDPTKAFHEMTRNRAPQAVPWCTCASLMFNAVKCRLDPREAIDRGISCSSARSLRYWVSILFFYLKLHVALSLQWRKQIEYIE